MCMWVSWRRDIPTCTNETLVHCIFEKEESFIAVNVYCTLVAVAHSTGIISVALHAYEPADHGCVDENGIVGFVMLKSRSCSWTKALRMLT